MVNEETSCQVLSFSTTTMIEHNDESISTVVMDIGSCNFRVGMSGELKPRHVLRTAVGRPKFKSSIIDYDNPTQDSYVGYKLQEMRTVLSIQNTVQHGIVTNWDDWEKLVHHGFYECVRAAPEEHIFLSTTSLLGPKADTEKMTQIAFETFNVPAFYHASPSTLAVSYLSLDTGLIVDVGHGLTTTYPLVGGALPLNSIKRQTFGGDDVTKELKKRAGDRGYEFETSEDWEIVREMKEKIVAVALDFDEKMYQCHSNFHEETEYQLPDGQLIHLKEQRYQASEILFQPNLVGRELLSVAELAHESIQACAMSARKELCSNIVLIGGTARIPGFKERFEREFVAIANMNVKVKVTLAPEHCGWTGGAVFASFSQFPSLVISKEEYDESGPSVIRCRRF